MHTTTITRLTDEHARQQIAAWRREAVPIVAIGVPSFAPLVVVQVDPRKHPRVQELFRGPPRQGDDYRVQWTFLLRGRPSLPNLARLHLTLRDARRPMAYALVFDLRQHREPLTLLALTSCLQLVDHPVRHDGDLTFGSHGLQIDVRPLAEALGITTAPHGAMIGALS